MNDTIIEVERFQPPKPESLEALDISPTLVQDVFLRSLREEGLSSLGSMRDPLEITGGAA